jgi:hypothetical protein
MPLNWNATEIQYFKDNPDELWVKSKSFGEEYDDVNAETKSLIFGSMAVGIGRITETSAPEFYGRWKVLEKIDDICVTSVYDGTDIIKNYITPDIVSKHIGLSMNVIDISRTKWAANYLRNTPHVKNKYRPTDIASIVNFYSLEYKEAKGFL